MGEHGHEISSFARLLGRPRGFSFGAWRANSLLIALILLLGTGSASGVDPKLSISQYAHIPWRLSERGLTSPPLSIVQGSDGYIWIGTAHGLYRFDGVRFSLLPERGPGGGIVTSISYLRANPDGSLYLSTYGYGVIRLFKGSSQQIGHYTLDPGPFVPDAEGNVWFTPGRFSDKISLCKLTGETEKCFGTSDGGPAGPFGTFLRGADGFFYLGGENAVFRWAPGKAVVKLPLPENHPTNRNLVVALERSSDGTLLAGTAQSGPGAGLLQLRNGTWQNVRLAGFDGASIRVRCLYRDSHDSLWIGTLDQGLYRIVGNRVDHFDSKSGLTADTVSQIFEDREGSLWVVTPKGLDQFHNLAVVSFGKNQGIPGGSAVATTIGSNEVWAGALDGLYTFHADGSDSLRHITIRSVGQVTDLYRDASGTMWVSGERTLVRAVGERFVPITYQHSPLIGKVVELSEDPNGDLWVITMSSEYGSALNHIKGNEIVERIVWPKTLGDDTFSSISANPKGGLWVNTARTALYWFHNGSFQLLRPGGSGGYGLVPDRTGAWAYPANDLLRLQNNEIRELNLHIGSRANQVLNMIDDGHGSLWLYMSLGLVRLSTSDVNRWFADPGYTVPYELFDMADGVAPGVSFSRAGVSSDGTVWFSNSRELQRINPKNTERNTLPPRVHIEQFFVDGKELSFSDKNALAPRVRNLEIRYAGLSYVNPDKVLFKYRLLGLDDHWIDAGSRREALFNNLKPGHYRFQVIASNNNGLWNTEGETLSFVIPPAWFQTRWFYATVILTVLFIFYAIVLMERKRYTTVVKAKLQERLDERTRIARNLHDTLIQTIHGTKLAASGAREHLEDPKRMDSALEQLSLWLDRASEEGRVALDSLRASSPIEDLASALFRTAEESAPLTMRPNIVITGSVRELQTFALDEIYRIAAEAIRNACLHSNGTTLTITLEYGQVFQLEVQDNGIGCEPSLLEIGRPGHFGIEGMRERARSIHATLTIDTEPGTGTRVSLLVSKRIAYKWWGSLFAAQLRRRLDAR
jgi:signal transduction histidine kinase/ligand-binding sensor domain-containing protein